LPPLTGAADAAGAIPPPPVEASKSAICEDSACLPRIFLGPVEKGLMESMPRPSRMSAARARRRVSLTSKLLLLLLVAALALSAGAQAASIPLLGTAGGEASPTATETGASQGAAAAAGQSAAALGTGAVKQAASLLPPSSSSPATAPGAQGATQTLAAGAGAAVQRVVSGAASGSPLRTVTRIAESATGAGALAGAQTLPASTIERVRTLGSNALDRSAQLLDAATSRGVALAAVPTRVVAGAPIVAPALSRLIGTLAHGTIPLPLALNQQQSLLAVPGPGGGSGPHLPGREIVLSGGAAGPFAQPAQMPPSLDRAGLALGSVFGNEAGSGGYAIERIARSGGVTGAGAQAAGALGASRAPPAGPSPGTGLHRAAQSAAEALSALLDSLVGGSGVASAAGASVAIALMLAALLLHGPPSITRSLLLTRSRSPALAFALIPERPG
jgi:hypothetical protein